MALGIHPPGKREPDKFERRGFLLPGPRVLPKHDAAQFHRPDAAFQIHFVDQGDPRILQRRNVGQEPPRVEVDGVCARGLDQGQPQFQKFFFDVFHRCVAVNLVFHFQRFEKAHRDHLQVPARQPPVGRKPFGQNQQVLELFRPLIVVTREEAADIGEAVLFGAHQGGIGV